MAASPALDSSRAVESSTAFDIVGDVHGCIEELLALLQKLGYELDIRDGEAAAVSPPAGRKLLLLGDLVNRGPQIAAVLRFAMTLQHSGAGVSVAGNHDVALARKLRGEELARDDLLKPSLTQMRHEPEAFRQEVIDFVESMPRWLKLDGGRLIVAHAGLPQQYHDAPGDEADDFAVNGRSIRDEDGRTVRYQWADDYTGEPLVVYGHYARETILWRNNSVCIDTGCVYGGSLTALRYPELETVSVPARRVYHRTPQARSYRRTAAAIGG